MSHGVGNIDFNAAGENASEGAASDDDAGGSGGDGCDGDDDDDDDDDGSVAACRCRSENKEID